MAIDTIRINGTDYNIGGTQQQADWNQTDNTAVDYIKNKPTIPSTQVQSDWTQTDEEEPSYIQNKPSIANISASNTTLNIIGSGSTVSTHNYSTDEQVIGTWVDGKTVYEKSFTGTIGASEFDIVHGVSNLGNIIEVNYCTGPKADSFRIVCNGNGIQGMSIWVSDNYIRLAHNPDSTGLNYYVTMRYTKTTD